MPMQLRRLAPPADRVSMHITQQHRAIAVGVSAQSHCTNLSYGTVMADNLSTGYGLRATSTSGTAIYGASASSSNYGVYATNTGGGTAIGAIIPATLGSFAVYATNPGNVAISTPDQLAAGSARSLARYSGSLSSGMPKSFLIDHPLDPANRYLAHACLESPEVKNIYDGEVVADDSGEAVVRLPSYFEALNTKCLYQLTAVDRAAPNIHVKERVRGGRFGYFRCKPRTDDLLAGNRRSSRSSNAGRSFRGRAR